MKVRRGYFALGGSEGVVHVTSDQDFTVAIWARNIETFGGGIQVLTPPSRFRTPAASGPQDGLVLEVPAQTGMNLGSIGGRGGETFDISNSSGARMVVFLTLSTTDTAHVDMTGVPA
jgi:hypothetical protein